MSGKQVLDIWVHSHRHGIDVYPTFRSADACVGTLEELVAEHTINFEPHREEEHLELAITTFEVPPIE